MNRKELLDISWQLSQDLARLLTLKLHNDKLVSQEAINDIQNHLEIVELLLAQQSWKA